MHPVPWLDMLNKVREYIETHQGRYPTPRRGTAAAKTVELGRWWHSQLMHRGLGNLSAGRAAAIRDTEDLAERLRREAKGRKGRSSYHEQMVRAAARRSVREAKRALDSPHLIPGDAEILQLRIDHPAASTAELAALAGMSKPALVGKLRGAMTRTAASRPNRRD